MHNKRTLLRPPLPRPPARPNLGSARPPEPRPQLELAPGPQASRYPEGGGGRRGNNWAGEGKTRGPERQDSQGVELGPYGPLIGQGRPTGHR